MRDASAQLLSLLALKCLRQPAPWYKLVLHCLGVLAFYSLFYAAFFSPVCFANRLLAPTDGFIYYVPGFYAPWALWTHFLHAGFPVTADPQIQSWYLLKLLYSPFGAWNSFVISAYVLASCFTYGYVYTLTTSHLASLISGLIYGMSGFMMVHLAHTTIVHNAIWLPLLILALERLRHRITSYWFVVAIVALVCSALAGHTQIFVYSLSISAAYVAVLGWSAVVGRWKYYSLYVAIVVFGMSLAAIQLLPTAELARLGLRSEINFTDFVSYSLPPYQALSLLFPHVFGGIAFPYFGAWNLAEITGYIGLLPLMMATVGFMAYRYKAIVWFWLGTSLLAFLLALGDATPLAKLMYLLPVHNKFRALARHFMEMALAVSVLSGLGVSVIQQNIIKRKLIIRVVLATTGLILISLSVIFIFHNRFQSMAIERGIQHIEILPWYNAVIGIFTIGIPIIIFVLSSIVFIFWSGKCSSSFYCILIISVLTIDLGSFGWFCEWRYASPSKDILLPTTIAEHYAQLLHVTHQRLLPVNGASGVMTEMPPNMSWLWRVPSASGYGPLMLSRISQLLAMSPDGRVADTWTRASNRSLDILAVRYLFLAQRNFTSPSLYKGGWLWTADDLHLTLGSDCVTLQPEAVKLQLPTPIAATAIGMVTYLGCSKAIPDEATVLQIAVADTRGTVHRQQVLAGRDTAEWAYDCEDVLPHMQHRRATIFESFLNKQQSFKPCEGHKYFTMRPLEGIMNVNSIELRWVGGQTGAISIHKIGLLDEQNGRSFPLSAVSLAVADGARWRHVEEIGTTVVYENLRAMPRVWMVPEVVTLTPQEVLRAIQTSQLPDGRIYDPSQLALVEESVTFEAPNRETGTAHVVHLADTHVEVQTLSPTPSFLVLSDAHYPGWEVTIDGIAAHLFRTNYVLRGLMVPAGRHLVRFVFRPRSLYLGASISAVAAVCLLGMVAIGAWRRACRAPV